jgi:hypothetical protein
VDTHLDKFGAAGIHDLLSLGPANHGELAGIKVGNRGWRKSFRYELGILLDRAGAETAEHVAQRLGGTICRADFAIVDREIIDAASRKRSIVRWP